MPPSSIECHGNGPDHCCYLGAAGACKYLEEYTVPGRRWVCGLRRHFGSWAKVHESPIYLTTVKPLLVDAGVQVDCGDWPQQVNMAAFPFADFCCFRAPLKART